MTVYVRKESLDKFKTGILQVQRNKTHIPNGIYSIFGQGPYTAC
jgi:hypothetical protein